MTAITASRPRPGSTVVGLGSYRPDRVVTNADLSFTTRFQAAEAPGRLQALQTIDKAIGIIASTQKISVGEARRRLHQAGALAGVAPDKVARAVLQDLSR